MECLSKALGKICPRRLNLGVVSKLDAREREAQSHIYSHMKVARFDNVYDNVDGDKFGSPRHRGCMKSFLSRSHEHFRASINIQLIQEEDRFSRNTHLDKQELHMDHETART